MAVSKLNQFVFFILFLVGAICAVQMAMGQGLGEGRPVLRILAAIGSVGAAFGAYGVRPNLLRRRRN